MLHAASPEKATPRPAASTPATRAPAADSRHFRTTPEISQPGLWLHCRHSRAASAAAFPAGDGAPAVGSIQARSIRLPRAPRFLTSPPSAQHLLNPRRNFLGGLFVGTDD